MYMNLIDLCLDTIVENFQRYNLFFETTEDDNIKLMLQFLQRKYSLDLLERLSMKDNFPVKCLDILINKYLKFLNTTWFRKCPWYKVASKIAEIGCTVEEISFKPQRFVEADYSCGEKPWHDIICHLPNLKNLSFNTICHDLIIKNIAKFCPNIEEINVEKSDVTFEGLKYLCENENGKSLCTKLKKLSISGLLLTDDDVKYLLKNLPSLEIIDYLKLPLVLHSLHKDELACLDKVKPYNITTLNLMSFAKIPFFVDILKVCLSVCPHLKSFTCGLIKEDELNYFSNLFDLEKLHIENCSDSKINVNNLLKSKGGKLTSLTVVNCEISVSIIAESCPHLKELILNKVKFLFDEDLKVVFNSLSSCTFENSNASTSARAMSLLLLSSSKLESISFISCNLLSTEIKGNILKCCELYAIKQIFFYMTVTEKEYIKELLLNCHTLSSLDVSFCFERDEEVELMKFAEILSNKPKIIIRKFREFHQHEFFNLDHQFELHDDDLEDIDPEDPEFAPYYYSDNEFDE